MMIVHDILSKTNLTTSQNSSSPSMSTQVKSQSTKVHQGLLETLQNEMKKRILFLDGAMGTSIQKFDLNEPDFRGKEFADVKALLKGNNELLNITRPDVIRSVYKVPPVSYFL